MDDRRLKRLSVCPSILTEMFRMKTSNWNYDVSYEGMPDDARIVDSYFVHSSNTLVLIVHSESFELNPYSYEKLPTLDIVCTKVDYD